MLAGTHGAHSSVIGVGGKGGGPWRFLTPRGAGALRSYLFSNAGASAITAHAVAADETHWSCS
jgi:hypothetical protein